jgi:hypothetical protein
MDLSKESLTLLNTAVNETYAIMVPRPSMNAISALNSGTPLCSVSYEGCFFSRDSG